MPICYKWAGRSVGVPRPDEIPEESSVDALTLAARLMLAAVFLTAGVTKLVDRAGSRRGLAEFGVPGPLTGPLGVLLPIAELGVAVGLLPAATAWWAAVGALGLLLLFILAIGANLARGRQPECRCFGQIGAGPVSLWTILRNVVLAAAAGLIVQQGLDR